MKKIIYIMGAGRSGTTLLDTILGNNPDIFSAGELNRFPKYYGKPMEVEEQSATAIFWNKFKSQLPEEWQQNRFKNIHRLCHSFEYHSYIYKLWFPFLFSRQINQYKAYLSMFFKSLESLIAESTLVDSSKYPLRGYYLSRFLNYEIVYIYIKRNPIYVTRSFAKKGIEQPPQPWLNANIYMFIVNNICLYLLGKIRNKCKIIEIRYEDLITDPVSCLSEIGKKLDLDLTHSIQLAQTRGPFLTGLLFDGNRIRLEKEIYLQNNQPETIPTGLKDKVTLLMQRAWWKQLKTGNC